MEKSQKYPSEIVSLPSKGYLYSKESGLSSGEVEMKYMTAKEEDILTNQNYIEKGIVIDKLLQSLIVDKNVKYGDLLVGDKNALLVAARILSYGKDYEFTYKNEPQTVDLSLVEHKELHKDITPGCTNEFAFTLPATGTVLTFKLLTHNDEVMIEQEVKGMKKIQKESSPELTTRLKHMILSVDGDSSSKAVRDFVDNRFLARDAREFRKYVTSLQPDVDLTFYPEDGPEGGVSIPVGITFFWPDVRI